MIVGLLIGALLVLALEAAFVWWVSRRPYVGPDRNGVFQVPE